MSTVWRVACGALFMGLLVGCASSPDAPTASKSDSSVVDAPYAAVWQATRQALLDQNYRVYTRDTRGLFVAYSKKKRRFLLFPHRTQFTITLEALDEASTRVDVETIHQRYRVTLLTYPDWHDDTRPPRHEGAAEILEAIEQGVDFAAGENRETPGGV